MTMTDARNEAKRYGKVIEALDMYLGLDETQATVILATWIRDRSQGQTTASLSRAKSILDMAFEWRAAGY